MGFGGLATTIIMFIAVLLVSTGVLLSLQLQIDESQASMRAQADLLNDKIATNIDVISANYTAGTTTIYVLNNGKTILDIGKIDVFLDNAYIPRNTSNRTIEVESSTDTTNPGLWDPNEQLKVEIFKTIGNGTHTTLISTQYGVTDLYTFST